jgi:threonine aldolase
MTTYSFMDDYSEGCHPSILEALSRTNMSQQMAYGDDDYSAEAQKLIRAQVGNPDAAVHLVAGGTLANLISIANCLRPHEAVISAASGHIAMRETGAIEATGHKIIAMPSKDGKLTPEDVERALVQNAHVPHMVKPRLVYISNATEFGTVYTKAELQALSALCKAKDLLFFMDGARLGAALSADICDVTLEDIAAMTDMFWIGGTKAGALIGEAIVISNPALAVDFAFHIKQRGAMLAKGRLLGVQFMELFKSGLFFDLTKNANQQAQKISGAIVASGYELAATTESNQIFPILPNALIAKLQESFKFYVWEPLDNDRSVLRLVTSWATDEAQVDEFIQVVESA